MPFFTFNQNNSGGCFIGPHYICVEAKNSGEADEIAKDHGVYFDGVENGEDCECCGDRWHRMWDAGDDKPEIYGKPIEEYTDSWGGTYLIVRAGGSTEEHDIPREP